jgi:hypothetical protein
MIGTVRNVGYKFVRPSRNALGAPPVGLLDDDGAPGDDEEGDRVPRPAPEVAGRPLGAR